MPAFAPAQLAEWSRGSWTAPPAQPVTGFSHDTRTLQPGQVFVALKSGRRDGREFLAAAQAAGAAGAIVSRPDPALALPQLATADPLTAFQAIARGHRRSFSGPVVGISGSAGKTSTKDLLAVVLGSRPSDPSVDREAEETAPDRPEESAVLATEGNLNNQIGVPLTLTRLDPSVHHFAVIEAGVGATGEMEPLARMIEPDLAIVTLVAPAHIDGLGDLEGVAREKAALPAAVRPAGIAFFPRQCARFGAFRDLDVRKMIIEPAEVVLPAEPAKDKVYFAVSQRGDTTAVTIVYPTAAARLRFTLQRVSAGMAQNAVLAICAALWLGVAPGLIQERLAGWRPARWRGELRREGGRLLYLDFYNANPASMADALDNFDTLAPAGQPRAYVLGCMEELGPRSADYHRELGRALRLRPDDRVFLIGEHAAALRAGLLDRGADPARIEVATEAAGIAAALADFHGAVFFKGSRRHQLENALARMHHTAGEPATREMAAWGKS